jgi:putative transposase
LTNSGRFETLGGVTEDPPMPAVITDALWAKLEPLVERAKRSAAGAPPQLPDRVFLEALLYLADSGCKWRQLPERFGAWDAVYNRFRRWVRAGVFERLFADHTPAAAGLDGVRRVFLDSTIVRAHPHAAGAKGGRRRRASAGRGAGSGPRSTSPARATGRRSR